MSRLFARLGRDFARADHGTLLQLPQNLDHRRRSCCLTFTTQIQPKADPSSQLTALVGFIALSVFAKNIEMLLVGQIFCGYASPTPLSLPRSSLTPPC